jgi:hypothetical protein
MRLLEHLRRHIHERAMQTVQQFILTDMKCHRHVSSPTPNQRYKSNIRPSLFRLQRSMEEWRYSPTITSALDGQSVASPTQLSISRTSVIKMDKTQKHINTGRSKKIHQTHPGTDFRVCPLMRRDAVYLVMLRTVLPTG